MPYYVFLNQYNTVVYVGQHVDAASAWAGFYDTCKYPLHARVVSEVLQSGIYFRSWNPPKA